MFQRNPTDPPQDIQESPEIENALDLGERSEADAQVSEEEQHSLEKKREDAQAELLVKISEQATEAGLLSPILLKNARLSGGRRVFYELEDREKVLTELLDNPSETKDDKSLRAELAELRLEKTMILVMLLKQQHQVFSREMMATLEAAREGKGNLGALEARATSLYKIGGLLDAFEMVTDDVIKQHSEEFGELTVNRWLYDLNNDAFTYLNMGDHKDRLQAADKPQKYKLFEWIDGLRIFFNEFPQTVNLADIHEYIQKAQVAAVEAHPEQMPQIGTVATGSQFVFGAKRTDANTQDERNTSAA